MLSSLCRTEGVFSLGTADDLRRCCCDNRETAESALLSACQEGGVEHVVKFSDVEGLREVDTGTGLHQPVDLSARSIRADCDDWNRGAPRVRPKPAEHFMPVNIRQVYVEEDELGAMLLRQTDAGDAFMRSEKVDAGAPLQEPFDQAQV